MNKKLFTDPRFDSRSCRCSCKNFNGAKTKLGEKSSREERTIDGHKGAEEETKTGNSGPTTDESC